MGLHELSSATYAQDLRLLSSLRTTLHAFPSDMLDDVFTPPLINYAVFPLTNLLQRINPLEIRSRLLEEILLSLAFLVHRWKRADGVPTKTWEQLWILVAIVLGGPPSSKGKHRELEDELKAACLAILEALLTPQCEEIGESPMHPSQDMMAMLFASKSLTPMLFHSTSALLDLLVSTPNTDMKARSLHLLRLLMTTYLRGRNEMLASVMPGALSTLVKVVEKEGGLLQSRMAVGISGLTGDIITCTVNDADMQRKGVLSPRVTKLSQLAEDAPPISAGRSSVELAKPPDKSKEAFPNLNMQYLEFTQTQIMSALGHLVPALQKHASTKVRSALVESLERVARDCAQSLPRLQEPLLSSLLYLGKDDFDEVQARAMLAVSSLVRDATSGQETYETIRVILERNVSAFPQHVMSRSDSRVLETTKIVSSIASVVLDVGSDQFNPIQQVLGPDGGIQRWSLALLRCLEFGEERSIGDQTNAAQRAWQLAQGRVDWQDRPLLEGNPIRPEETPYPELLALHIEAKATLATVATMLEDLGQAAGGHALFAVDHLAQLARNRRAGPDVAVAASAFWVVERLLQGLSRRSEVSNLVQKTALNVMNVVMTMDDDTDGDFHEEDIAQEQDALITVERARGMDTVALLLHKPTTRTTQAEEQKTRRLQLLRHRQQVSAFSLSIMAVCSDIMGVAFRPLLLRCLYTVLSHLGSPSRFLERYAGTAMIRIAYHAGYASPQNLVMDNVDYVINVVSQRMTYRRLEVFAPMVLISMIRLVGAPIVPLVQDVVDDIFDVLDDFHGYDLLASTFIAVLDTLIQAMSVDLPTWKPTAAVSTRVQARPDPQRDFNLLRGWYNERAMKARTAVEEYLAKAPQEPWREDQEEGEENLQEPPSGTQDEPEIPPTRQQEVCKRIMDKSIYYMTHDSSFIRTRVLFLFGAGIAVLVERESDLLPLVNRAWPYILNRLTDEEPYVVTEAARVIQALARYVGDFMSRRILDQAWPAMKKLLDTQNKLDDRSALVKTGHRVDHPFTVSHRLHVAIMDAICYVVQEVPVSDTLLREMINTFMPFLDALNSTQIQQSAVTLYQQMALRDEDAVWLALHAVLGDLEGAQQTYLRQPGLDIQHNLKHVLP